MTKHTISIMRFTVRLFPKKVRETVKRSQRLTNWYRRNLALSGIVSDSRWDPILQYKKNIKWQEAKIGQFERKEGTKQQLIVLMSSLKPSLFQDTVESIQLLNKSFDHIVLLCDAENRTKVEALLRKSVVQVANCQVVCANDTSHLSHQEIDGTFIVHCGDKVHRNCVYVLDAKLQEGSEIFYTDIDRFHAKKGRVNPEFYPDWNPDLQLTTGYVNSGVWTRNLKRFLQLESLNIHPGIIAEWLIMSFLQNRLPDIGHLPLTLVHRPHEKNYVFNKVTTSLFDAIRTRANINFSKPNQVLKLCWNQSDEPLVSLIIPTKNGLKLVQDCIESILILTNYPNYEILLVDNNSDDPECLAYFDKLAEHPRIRVLKYPNPFNYSAINNFAVKHAKGSVIGLVNNDIEVIEPDWLSYMVGHVMRPDIGCVGAKLLYDNNTVQHAGVVLGYGGGAGHAHKHFPHNHSGYLNRLVATQNFSAVTAACLLVTKADFEAVDGLNEVELTVAFNDVDLCLKVLELGRRNLYCAEAVLYHHESVSRGSDESKEKAERFALEVEYLQSTWKGYISHDPAYNPNLTLQYENFSLRDC